MVNLPTETEGHCKSF